jgi:hypothetical protein
MTIMQALLRYLDRYPCHAGRWQTFVTVMAASPRLPTSSIRSNDEAEPGISHPSASM